MQYFAVVQLLMVNLVPLWASRTTGKIIPVLYSYNSTFNPKLLNGSIQFYNIKDRKDSPLVGFGLFPVKPVTEAWIHATFSVIAKKGRLHAPIYNSRADFCDFLRQPSKYHIMSLVYNEVRRFGRIPSKCPIMPSWYVFSNISLRQIQLPSFLSEVDFLATIVGYIPGKDQYLRAQFVGALKKKLLPSFWEINCVFPWLLHKNYCFVYVVCFLRRDGPLWP